MFSGLEVGNRDKYIYVKSKKPNKEEKRYIRLQCEILEGSGKEFPIREWIQHNLGSVPIFSYRMFGHVCNCC